MSIAVHDASKTYRSRGGAISALEGVDLDARDGELVVVVGPSGSGKTTLLRCVAGLEKLDAGRIEVGGRDVTRADPGDRDVAMVFQEYALFPHLSVFENIAFGLRARKVAADVVQDKVRDAAALMDIADTLQRSPSELSGGERQRVALARAVVRSPAAFLLDEPLSNLDAELRTIMRAEIKALQRRLATTAMYVTHDQLEAMTMGDRIAVLHNGRVQQFATPREVYERPSSIAVARSIGAPAMNVFPASLLGRGSGFVGVRAEHMSIVPAPDGKLQGRVLHLDEVGHEVVVHVAVRDHLLLVRSRDASAIRVQDDVGVDLDEAHVRSFDGDGRATG